MTTVSRTVDTLALIESGPKKHSHRRLGSDGHAQALKRDGPANPRIRPLFPLRPACGYLPSNPQVLPMPVTKSQPAVVR